MRKVLFITVAIFGIILCFRKIAETYAGTTAPVVDSCGEVSYEVFDNTDCVAKDIHDVLIKDEKHYTKWDAFRYATYRLAEGLNTEFHTSLSDVQLYDGLMKTFFAECKFKVGDDAVNGLSGAKGLIQWMPSIRKKLDIPNDIHNYELVDQLPYAHTYLVDVINKHNINPKKIDKFIDVYCLIFAPAFADANDNAVFYVSCQYRAKQCPYFKNMNKKWKHKGKRCAYHSNNGYDLNKDGKLTKSEISDYIIGKHYKKK